MTILNSFDDWMFYQLIANTFHITLDQAHWWTNGVMMIVVVIVILIYATVEHWH